jgi:acyl-CoA reductase-like NAD-dependent aldehyde dehydrogenase
MQMLINGKWVDALDGETIEITNPATGEIIDRVPRAKAEDVNQAVEYAKVGYKMNRKIPAHQRYQYLFQAGEAILNNLEELRNLMVQENGKSHTWAEFEIRKTAEIFKTVAERVKEPSGVTYPMDSMFNCESQMAMTYRQPIGVIGGIIPFNFPAEMLAYKLAGALAGGNSVVIKLPEDCPLTCLRIGEYLLNVGVPPETFHLVTGYGNEAGEALIVHPQVPMISFTGSSAIGKHIMEKSAPYLKKLALELGGNDPVIIFEDADLDLVANSLIKGRMTVGNGQACVADKRFLIQESVAQKFVEKAKNIVASLKVGDPSDPTVDVGPVIHEKAANHIEKQIQDAVSKGAKIVTGGKKFNKTFIEPTILMNMTEDMDMMINECFGPVASIMTFTSEEEAISIANNSKYGLQGAVYTSNFTRAMKIADQLDVGGVVINGSSCFRPGNVPYMPRKESGLGTDNMFNCIEEMTYGKAIVFNGVRG